MLVYSETSGRRVFGCFDVVFSDLGGGVTGRALDPCREWPEARLGAVDCSTTGLLEELMAGEWWWRSVLETSSLLRNGGFWDDPVTRFGLLDRKRFARGGALLPSDGLGALGVSSTVGDTAADEIMGISTEIFVG